VELGVVAHGLEDLLQVVGADDVGAERAVLVGELGDLRQPDLVDLLGGLVGGRVVTQCRVVRLAPGGQPRESALLLGARERQHLTQGVTVGLQPRADRPLERLAEPGADGVPVDAHRQVHRREGRVVVDRDRQPLLDLADRLGHGELRGHPARLRTLTDPVCELPVVGTDAVELDSHRVGHGLVGHGQEPEQERQRDVQPVDRVGVAAGQRGVEQVGPGERRADDHPSRQPLLLLERRLVQRLGPGREVAQGGHEAVLRLAGGVLEAAHVGVVAEQVSFGGFLVEDRLPVVVRQLCEVVVHAGVLPGRGSVQPT
jgi:hypothetical protein